MRVAIANSDRQEVQGLRSLLDNSFKTCVITRADKLMNIIDTCDLLIIDSNYSPDQGINLLMNIESISHLPVLMIVPLDDSTVCSGGNAGQVPKIFWLKRRIIKIYYQLLLKSHTNSLTGLRNLKGLFSSQRTCK